MAEIIDPEKIAYIVSNHVEDGTHPRAPPGELVKPEGLLLAHGQSLVKPPLQAGLALRGGQNRQPGLLEPRPRFLEPQCSTGRIP